MDDRQLYRGIVSTGRGAGAPIMSAPGVLDGFQQWTGLSVIPGTLNIRLTQPIDLALLGYVTLAELGVEINLTELGIDFDGEAGWYYSQVVITDRYPAFVLFPTWTGDPSIHAELVSPHHLRTTLGLQDGDSIEFTLVDTDRSTQGGP